MRRTFWFRVAAIGAAITPAPANALVNRPPDAGLMTALSVKDARDLLTQAGVKIQQVEFKPDGFLIMVEPKRAREVWFEGMNCKGKGADMTCTEFKIAVNWRLDTPVHADTLVKQLGYNYTSVASEGADLYLWRMDFTYGGITREHLRQTVLELLELRRKAEDTIWPAANKAASPKP